MTDCIHPSTETYYDENGTRCRLCHSYLIIKTQTWLKFDSEVTGKQAVRVG